MIASAPARRNRRSARSARARPARTPRRRAQGARAEMTAGDCTRAIWARRSAMIELSSAAMPKSLAPALDVAPTIPGVRRCPEGGPPATCGLHPLHAAEDVLRALRMLLAAGWRASPCARTGSCTHLIHGCMRLSTRGAAPQGGQCVVVRIARVLRDPPGLSRRTGPALIAQ